MRLYEIDNAILDCVDVETGEVFDIEKFDELSMERDAKIESICLWIKNLQAEAEAYKKEKDTFAQRQKSAENKMESLKKYITAYLDGAKFETSRVKVGFRKSASLEVEDVYKIPDEYLRYKEPEVNKTELKKAIESGKTFDGVQIVEKLNISIK